MASNNNTPPDPIISSVHNLIPQIPRRRKHRNPGIAIAFRLRGSHSKKTLRVTAPPLSNIGKVFRKTRFQQGSSLQSGGSGSL
ncbi:hypothetical protein ACSQ67_012624 [Phaseolus vulgaris]